MSRELALNALFQRVSHAFPWATASRRMKVWSEVPARMRPALFQLESGPETYQWSSLALPRRSLDVKLFLYFDARDPQRISTALMNETLDAIDAALQPRDLDLTRGRQTLGGKVYDCKVMGVPVRDSGDLDGDGVAVVLVRLVIP